MAVVASDSARDRSGLSPVKVGVLAGCWMLDKGSHFPNGEPFFRQKLLIVSPRG